MRGTSQAIFDFPVLSDALIFRNLVLAFSQDLNEWEKLKDTDKRGRGASEKQGKLFSKPQSVDSELPNWLFGWCFVFQPTHRLPTFHGARIIEASTEAQKFTSWGQWLLKVLHNANECPCIDGHLLYEAISGNKIEKSVNSLLLFLVKCRVAEDANKKEPRLPLQVCALCCLQYEYTNRICNGFASVALNVFFEYEQIIMNFLLFSLYNTGL